MTTDLSNQARSAVKRLQRALARGQHAQESLYTEEMHAVLLRNKIIDSEDPLCLFRYFANGPCGEWYVYGTNADREHGNPLLMVFACLDDPALAEPGLVPLRRCEGYGLEDLHYPGTKIPMVELDNAYTPQRLSEITCRIRALARKRSSR